MWDDRTHRILEDMKTGLVELYGDRLRGLYVYGSYARGMQQAGSDLDVVFALDEYEWSSEEVARTGELVSRLSLEHELSISLIPIRDSDLKQKATLLSTSVAREGVAV